MKHETHHRSLSSHPTTPTWCGLIFCGPQALVENPRKAVTAPLENHSTRQSCMVLPQFSKRFMASWGLSAQIPDLPQSSLQPSCWKHSPSSEPPHFQGPVDNGDSAGQQAVRDDFLEGRSGAGPQELAGERKAQAWVEKQQGTFGRPQEAA